MRGRQVPRRWGFTLVEVVIVMILLGILAASALPKFHYTPPLLHQAAVEEAAAYLTEGLDRWTTEPSAAEVWTSATTAAEVYPVLWRDPKMVQFGGDERCRRVWQTLVGTRAQIRVAVQGDADFLAVADSGQCRYEYQHDHLVTRSIVFTFDDGKVSVVTR